MRVCLGPPWLNLSRDGFIIDCVNLIRSFLCDDTSHKLGSLNAS